LSAKLKDFGGEITTFFKQPQSEQVFKNLPQNFHLSLHRPYSHVFDPFNMNDKTLTIRLDFYHDYQ